MSTCSPAAPTARNRHYKDGNGDIVPNSGYDDGDRHRQGDGAPGRWPRGEAQRDHAGFPLPAPARTFRNQESVYHTNVVNNILDRPLSLRPARRLPLQFRRQRLLDHDRAGPDSRSRTARRAASAIRSPASSATRATSRSTPRASISTTPRASTSANSATPSPTAATASATR